MKPSFTADVAQAYNFAALAIRVGLILLGAVILIRVAGILASRIERRIKARHPGDEESAYEKRAKTIGGVLRGAARTTIIIVALMMAVRELGLDITPALAAAGGFGVAAGLGAQSIVRDWLVGFFIIYDNAYAVGDAVTIAGVSGTVESLTLRHTEVRDGEGALHYVPNGEIKVATNLTKSWSTPVVRIPVSLTEDPIRAQEVLERFVTEAANDPALKPFLREPPRVIGVEDIAPGQYTVLIQARTLPDHRLTVARALRYGALSRLRAAGISSHAPVGGSPTPAGSST